MEIGNRIVQLRKQKGMGRDGLGKAVGTSGAIIGRYERDEMNPSVEMAAKIADALGGEPRLPRGQHGRTGEGQKNGVQAGTAGKDKRRRPKYHPQGGGQLPQGRTDAFHPPQTGKIKNAP